MSWVEQFQTAFAYNEWANEKVLTAAARAGDEELAQPRVGSGGSIANDLAHIVGAQNGWLARLAGKDKAAQPETPTAGIVTDLRSRYDASHEALREYTMHLTEDELMRTIEIEWQGDIYTYKVWKILMHLANHGTQHRAEVGIALLGLGASPGDLDLDDFYFL